ncbi:MAG: hypothetical protein OXT70_02345 [Chloroflexota bacterium]|nr:hypothetical protein [Chloroflexota bacterium]
MALRDVIQEVRQEILAVGTGINEADAKAAFITPILAELGWRGLRRIRSEYAVEQGRMRLDYALLGANSKPVALIEAKAPREDLSTHVAQVLNYSFHEGVDICVLTTGIVWWLYLPREKGVPQERRFAELDLQTGHIEELAGTLEACLHYEALNSGAGEKRATELLARRQAEQRMRFEIPQAWQRLLSGPNEFLVELVQEEVEDATGVRPSTHQVAEAIKGYGQERVGSELIAHDHVSPKDFKSPVPKQRPTVDSAIPRTRRKLSQTPSPRAFRLWGTERPFSSATDMWLIVAGEVYQRHPAEFLQRAASSGRMRGRTRTYVSESGESMHSPAQIPNSPYFAETNNSRARSERLARALLEAFGYEERDLEIMSSE